jgi:hypothetical protein
MTAYWARHTGGLFPAKALVPSLKSWLALTRTISWSLRSQAPVSAGSVPLVSPVATRFAGQAGDCPDAPRSLRMVHPQDSSSSRIA